MHCPKGSVPIKRVSKEDLIIDKYLRSMVSNYYINNNNNNNNNNTGYQAVSQAPYVCFFTIFIEILFHFLR
ncbi:MAG: hypothetical protein N7Q72_05625, partial [Spiroplasma sp. Tabriz.8]|nr:hypothetical protein [Candidatus Regiella insecticola]MCZ8632725.1 hypothetical protein [Spiroplasma sp. Tabriz.8]